VFNDILLHVVELHVVLLFFLPKVGVAELLDEKIIEVPVQRVLV
jgi:hypothetical protein